jgi:transcriptional regulator with XRE-family HTH domain
MATFGDMLRGLRSELELSLGDLAKATNYSKGYLSNIERGNKPPTDDLARLCDQALGARGELVAAAHLDAAAARDATPWQKADLLRRVQASDASPSTLDALEATVLELCCQYPYRDAPELRGEAQGWLKQVASLLHRPVGLRQHSGLLVAAGWLALLIGCLEYDMGMRAAAESTRVAARGLGIESGHTEIIGWTHEMSAWFALTQGRYRDVIASAEAGQDAAHDQPVVIQLIAQEAKARARMGDGQAVNAALQRGEMLLDRLPTGARLDNHFAVDPGKWNFYCMDAYRLLADDLRAEEQAHISIGGLTVDGVERSPMRVAEARLTLGVIAARRGDLDQATDFGMKALGTQRRSLPSLLNVGSELDSELHCRYPHEMQTKDFREAMRSLK